MSIEVGTRVAVRGVGNGTVERLDGHAVYVRLTDGTRTGIAGGLVREDDRSRLVELEDAPTVERILGAVDVQARTGLSKSSIRRAELAGTFPRRRQVGPGRVGWLESEITAWIRALPAVELEQ